MAARFSIEPARDCTSLPPAEGESAVGALFVKQACEKTDPSFGQKIVIRVNYFRKPGQSGVNPQLPTQLTQGQFESSARLEVYQLDPPCRGSRLGRAVGPGGVPLEGIVELGLAQ